MTISLHDAALSGLDTVFSLELLKPTPESPSGLVSTVGLGGSTPLVATIGADITMMGLTRRYTGRATLRGATLTLAGIVDVG